MNIKRLLFSIIGFSIFLASVGRAMDITATNSGNWSDTNIWSSGTVPGADDDADIPSGITVTVDTNVEIQFIYDGGTVIMGSGSTLNLLQDQAIASTITLDAGAPTNTVIYSANPFFAKQCNYYNLVLANTNYVDPYPPYYPFEDFNNFSSASGPTPMNIAGNLTVMGAIKVQQGSGGAPITIGGDLLIGTNCIWDCSGDNLTVAGNLYCYGLLEDLNGALGSNYIGGNVVVCGAGPSAYDHSTGTGANGWNVSDVTSWGIGGSLTNNGYIYGAGYGCIYFDGAGVIGGSNSITLPTIAISGSYLVGTTIILTTNNPTLAGTVIFDLANTNQIVLRYAATGINTQTNYYSGNLKVINSGAPVASGSTFQLFNAASYAGTFDSEVFPSLSAGLSWVDDLAANGSIRVTGGGGSGLPIISVSQNGNLLTLSWDSVTYPGFSLQSQTNGAGISSHWTPVDGGSVSPFTVTIDPANPPVFFRLSNP